MISRRLPSAIIAIATLLLSACGGGGGSAAPPTTATLKLSTSTSGTLAPDAMSGIQISVILPAGVTVKANTGGSVQDGVVSVSGVAAPGMAQSLYTPASGATPGKLTIVVASNAGFGPGEFATVICDIAAGSYPTAGDFPLADFMPVDNITFNTTTISGLTPSVTVTLQ